MAHNKRVDDHYTKKARKEGYLARSAYKLQEIDEKHGLIDTQTKTVLDIGCAPGSWLQYLAKCLGQDEVQIIGFDIKPVDIMLPQVTTYEQDISEREEVKQILRDEGVEQVDLIVSDMAPDTIGKSDIDALRCINLIEKTLWMYDHYLKPGGKFAIKVFMGPGYQELIQQLKDQYGNSNIVAFKPKACRKKSKETYLVKRS